jgi:hypothetical protein
MKIFICIKKIRSTFHSEATVDLDQELANDNFILKMVISVDPYIRGLMRDLSMKSYSPPYKLNDPQLLVIVCLWLLSPIIPTTGWMVSFTVAQVLVYLKSMFMSLCQECLCCAQ